MCGCLHEKRKITVAMLPQTLSTGNVVDKKVANDYYISKPLKNTGTQKKQIVVINIDKKFNFLYRDTLIFFVNF